MNQTNGFIKMFTLQPVVVVLRNDAAAGCWTAGRLNQASTASSESGPVVTTHLDQRDFTLGNLQEEQVTPETTTRTR